MASIVVNPLPQVEPATRDLALTTRALAAAMLDPSARLNTRELAESVGITAETLTNVLNSDAFRTTVMDEFESKVMVSMLRSLHVLDELCSNTTVAPTARVQAAAQIVRGYEVITRARSRLSDTKVKAVDVFRKAMGQLDNLAKSKRITKHASTGIPSVGEVAAEEVQDAG